MDHESYKLLVYHLRKALDTFDLDAPHSPWDNYWYSLIKYIFEQTSDSKPTLDESHPQHPKGPLFNL